MKTVDEHIALLKLLATSIDFEDLVSRESSKRRAGAGPRI